MATDDPQVKAVTEKQANAHPHVPAERIEEMAAAALEKTKDARIQGHRIPLAEKEVRDRIIAEESVGAPAS